MVKQLKYFWIPESLVAIPLEQLSMLVSKEMDHCLLDFGPLRVVKQWKYILTPKVC